MRRGVLMLAAVGAMAGCARGDEVATRDSGMADTAAAQPVMADPDATPAGSNGVPAGYMGRVDRANQNIADARYTPVAGGGWEVVTGPHHILWQPADTASGSYTATVTLQQMESPTHPESFGILIGGSNLDQPDQKYGYFMVRGTGDYLVKTRDGDNTSNVVGWTASPAVPKANAEGRATYKLAVQVGTDSVRFSVNDAPVASVPRSALPTEGIVGVRIGHNLHVTTSPVMLTRGG